jgi:Helicase HerA, central domain
VAAAQGQAAIEAARRGGTPQTYSPHITDSRKYEALKAGEEQASVAQSVPTFAALLAAGTVGPGRPLLLGYDEDGAAITGNTGDLLSTIVAGLTGSGKTNTTAVLAAQAFMMGARFIVCDPHSEAEEDSLAGQLEPLAGAFVIDVATSDKEILAALQFASDVLTARLRTTQATATQKARAALVGNAPLLLIVDEANAVLARSTIGEAATQICEQVFSEGRKVKVYAALLGQTWIAARAGNTSALRDTAASKYVHRMPRNQARLLLPTDVAQTCERMPTGKAVLARRDGSITTVTLPRITEDDVKLVAGLLTAPPIMTMPAASNQPSSGASYRVIDAQLEGGKEDDEEAAPEGMTQAQIALLAGLMVQQAKQAEKLQQVFGCKANGGRAYQEAVAKLRQCEGYIAARAAVARR